MAAEPFKNAKKAKEGLRNAPIEGAAEGLRIEPFFATPGTHPFDQVEWERRSARIGDSSGKTVFEQKDVEVPASWSQLATNVAVSKYFYGEPGKKERENSVRHLVERVTRTITDMGKADGVFATDQDAERFYQELTYLCVNQYGAFNSPVWFNVGLFHHNGVPGSEGNYHWDAKDNGPAKTLRGYEYPQGSACFIQAVEDSMEDIMRLAAAEAMLFKYGSGSGTDLSTLRSSREKLAGGGTPSGPLSFMRVFDQIAGVVKSGGKTRRAAKM
ncbi:MAG: vitamin B12-dependent ribonucleotide reductase, partial [Planctomycetota bacterium]|nr:vitamin B12-dependent ribonucleotide reductase [Planctomycetota bacterium]